MGAGKALIKAAEQGAEKVLSKKELKAQLKAAKRTARENRKNAAPAPKPPAQTQPNGPSPKETARAEYRAARDKKHAEKAEVRQRSKAEAEQKRRNNKQAPSPQKAPVQRATSSVYNPANTPSTPPGGYKLPNKHLDDLKPKTSSPSPSTSKTMETGAGKGGPAPESAPAAEEKKGGWWSTIKGLYKGAQNAPNEFQKGTSEMVGKISGGKFKAADAGIEEGEHWWSSNAKNHMLERTNRERNNLYSQMQGAKTQEELNKVMEDAGIKYKAGMSAEEVGKNIDAKYMSQLQNGPTYGDYFHGNHGAGALAFGMTGAGVLALSDSRGKRSNSDLYSNPF